ncbi:hypothetical protein [Selenomonas ruminantium]|uniref:Uncharacterized protein n=1 Tax=Selenomonas ruminantium TaxID=971 RepID=A0A1I0W0Z5_SELRU|nr:hypothetical protein [Selenomonas ruminantium]SFA82282.1 hypothetical protein SAMN05216587_10226 [Selenomonas ruminantium]
MTPQNSQKDYTFFERRYQVFLPFNLEFQIGKDIPRYRLKTLRRKLKARQKEQGIEFVHGIGKRKTNLQKAMEQLDEFIAPLKKYNQYLHIMGNRNSPSTYTKSNRFGVLRT